MIQAIPLETPHEAAIINRALKCNRINASRWDGGKPPRRLLRNLLRIEQLYMPPNELKGLMLAMACHESGFYPGVEGDQKFSINNKPKAIGILQQWPWYEHSFGIDRRNPQQAMFAQMQHLQNQLVKVTKLCGHLSLKRRWIIAQVRSVRGPTTRCIARIKATKGTAMKQERLHCERCYQVSKHYI